MLKVLLADRNSDRASAIQECLEASATMIVLRAPLGADLLRSVADTGADVVIVDMDLPDRDALEGIRAITSAAARPVVMFTDQDDPAFMEAAIDAGVSSYNVVGAALPDIKPIVASAVALFRRYRQIEEELEKTKATLDERAVLDRAKAILMRRRGFGEPEAYHWLRRKAMNENRRIVEVAAELVAQNPSRKVPE